MGEGRVSINASILISSCKKRSLRGRAKKSAKKKVGLNDEIK